MIPRPHRESLDVRNLTVPALLAVAACRGESPANDGAIAGGFYRTVIAQRVSGAPSREQLDTLAPFLSDSLRTMLAAARARSDSDAARHPDEKPAFAEGDLFSSLFEGPNEAVVLDSAVAHAGGRVPVTLTYRGASPPLRWTDTAIVIRQHGRAVIDDIIYGGAWDFANRGTLRATLLAARAGR